jgi:cytochrome c oxidase subunit 3
MAHQTEYVMDAGGPQPFHLVKPSPWPIIGAASGLGMAAGGVWFMHGGPAWGVILGFVCVLLTMIGWWRDVLHEAVVEKAHTALVKIGLRYGMALFIASEVMFFVAFFWAFFSSALFPSAAIKNTWPPPGIKPMDPFHFPLLMTMVLLLSGTTVTWAHHEIIEGKREDALNGLRLTVLLGVIFTCIQMFEYAHSAFDFRAGIFSSTFYMATGFHGFHVLVGTIFLAVCLWRVAQNQLTPKSHFGFEAAAWYWHFVDVVWLYLFVSIYIWGGLGAGHATPA